jgi:hypothetical protein
VLVIVIVIEFFMLKAAGHEHEKRELRNREGVDLAIHSLSSV